MPRRFPPPWTLEDTGHSWCVRDASGFSMCWFCYSEDVIGTNPERMSREDAYKLAKGFARLPELLGANRAKAE
jgi:hypothetical protein